MSINDISDTLINTLDNESLERGKALLYVFQSNKAGKLKRTTSGNIAGGYRYIRFEFNPQTKIVTKISIVFVVP